MDREEDKLADGVDVAIFYGRGNWPGLRAERLYAEYLLPMCSPEPADRRSSATAEDLAYLTLLHDVSRRDWLAYTRQLGLQHINVQRGRSSATAPWWCRRRYGEGVALVNNVMRKPRLKPVAGVPVQRCAGQ